MKLDDLLDMGSLARMTSERYVNVQTHPKLPGYRIWNYSHKAQYDKCWNDVTLTCRGLITDDEDNVIARPFRKFFNIGEMTEIPSGHFTVQEKMDGSLGIAWPHPDGYPAIATRGSFTSEQAQWATCWLNADQARVEAVEKMIGEGLTPLFEIIYPSNRIVLDYGDREDLTLLTTINLRTGLDLDMQIPWPGPVAPHYPGLDLETMQAMERDNAEGFVLCWGSGAVRAKVKHGEYVRLHRLLTGVNARTIWDLVANEQSLDDILTVVPDEFYQWVHSIVDELWTGFRAVEAEALDAFAKVPMDVSRKEQAALITQSTYPGIVFAMLDRKPYAKKIWAMLRPEASRPFKDDEA